MFDIAEKEYLARVALGAWHEEVFFSWMRIGMCREFLGKPVEQVADAFMMAFETAPNRVEPLYHLSCIYRKHNRPRNAFLVASLGLSIPLPENDILFVDKANYQWGIFDEVATTAYYTGRPHIGAGVCEKLLKEPYLPADQRERVANNFKIYTQALQQMQQAMMEQQKQWAEKVAKETNKTTLNITPEIANMKL